MPINASIVVSPYHARSFQHAHHRNFDSTLLFPRTAYQELTEEVESLAIFAGEKNRVNAEIVALAAVTGRLKDKEEHRVRMGATSWMCCGPYLSHREILQDDLYV